MAIDP
jgi:ATP-binding cassette, subfamily B, bacterial